MTAQEHLNPRRLLVSSNRKRFDEKTSFRFCSLLLGIPARLNSGTFARLENPTEDKFDFYDAMEKFLDEHLHPETAAASGGTTAGSN